MLIHTRTHLFVLLNTYRSRTHTYSYSYTHTNLNHSPTFPPNHLPANTQNLPPLPPLLPTTALVVAAAAEVAVTIVLTGTSVSSAIVTTAIDVPVAVPFTNGGAVGSVVVALVAVALLPVTGEKPGRWRGKHFARRGWESFCVEEGVVSVVEWERGGWREGDMGRRTKSLNDQLPLSGILDLVSEPAAGLGTA